MKMLNSKWPYWENRRGYNHWDYPEERHWTKKTYKRTYSRYSYVTERRTYYYSEKRRVQAPNLNRPNRKFLLWNPSPPQSNTTPRNQESKPIVKSIEPAKEIDQSDAEFKDILNFFGCEDEETMKRNSNRRHLEPKKCLQEDCEPKKSSKEEEPKQCLKEDLELKKCVKEDLELKKCVKEDLELKKCTTEDLELKKCTTEDLELKKCTTEDLEPKKCPKEDLEPKMCQKDDSESKKHQNEETGPKKPQNEDPAPKKRPNEEDSTTYKDDVLRLANKLKKFTSETLMSQKNTVTYKLRSETSKDLSQSTKENTALVSNAVPPKLPNKIPNRILFKSKSSNLNKKDSKVKSSTILPKEPKTPTVPTFDNFSNVPFTTEQQQKIETAQAEIQKFKIPKKSNVENTKPNEDEHKKDKPSLPCKDADKKNPTNKQSQKMAKKKRHHKQKSKQSVKIHKDTTCEENESKVKSSVTTDKNAIKPCSVVLERIDLKSVEKPDGIYQSNLTSSSSDLHNSLQDNEIQDLLKCLENSDNDEEIATLRYVNEEGKSTLVQLPTPPIKQIAEKEVKTPDSNTKSSSTIEQNLETKVSFPCSIDASVCLKILEEVKRPRDKFRLERKSSQLDMPSLEISEIDFHYEDVADSTTNSNNTPEEVQSRHATTLTSTPKKRCISESTTSCVEKGKRKISENTTSSTNTEKAQEDLKISSPYNNTEILPITEKPDTPQENATVTSHNLPAIVHDKVFVNNIYISKYKTDQKGSKIQTGNTKTPETGVPTSEESGVKVLGNILVNTTNPNEQANPSQTTKDESSIKKDFPTVENCDAVIKMLYPLINRTRSVEDSTSPGYVKPVLVNVFHKFMQNELAFNTELFPKAYELAEKKGTENTYSYIYYKKTRDHIVQEFCHVLDQITYNLSDVMDFILQICKYTNENLCVYICCLLRLLSCINNATPNSYNFLRALFLRASMLYSINPAVYKSSMDKKFSALGKSALNWALNKIEKYNQNRIHNVQGWILSLRGFSGDKIQRERMIRYLICGDNNCGNGESLWDFRPENWPTFDQIMEKTLQKQAKIQPVTNFKSSDETKQCPSNQNVPSSSSNGPQVMDELEKNTCGGKSVDTSIPEDTTNITTNTSNKSDNSSVVFTTKQSIWSGSLSQELRHIRKKKNSESINELGSCSGITATKQMKTCESSNQDTFSNEQNKSIPAEAPRKYVVPKSAEFLFGKAKEKPGTATSSANLPKLPQPVVDLNKTTSGNKAATNKPNVKSKRNCSQTCCAHLTVQHQRSKSRAPTRATPGPQSANNSNASMAHVRMLLNSHGYQPASNQPMFMGNVPTQPMSMGNAPTQPMLMGNAPTQPLFMGNAPTQSMSMGIAPTQPMSMGIAPTQPMLMGNAPTQTISMGNASTQIQLMGNPPAQTPNMQMGRTASVLSNEQTSLLQKQIMEYNLIRVESLRDERVESLRDPRVKSLRDPRTESVRDPRLASLRDPRTESLRDPRVCSTQANKGNQPTPSFVTHQSNATPHGTGPSTLENAMHLGIPSNQPPQTQVLNQGLPRNMANQPIQELTSIQELTPIQQVSEIITSHKNNQSEETPGSASSLESIPKESLSVEERLEFYAKQMIKLVSQHSMPDKVSSMLSTISSKPAEPPNQLSLEEINKVRELINSATTPATKINTAVKSEDKDPIEISDDEDDNIKREL